MEIHIFVDGASRNNPGPSGAGVFVTHGDEVICKQGYYLGKKTNNQAEYLALLLALFITTKHIAKSNPARLIITSDSELLIRQMSGFYKVRNPELMKIKLIIDMLLEDKSCSFKHVLRDKNKIADELANKGIDSKKAVPEAFRELLAKNNVTL